MCVCAVGFKFCDNPVSCDVRNFNHVTDNEIPKQSFVHDKILPRYEGHMKLVESSQD